MVLYCNITSHVEYDPDERIFLSKGGDTFPLITIMDARAGVLSRHPGFWTVESFEDTLTRVRRKEALKDRIQAGETLQTGELLIQEWELGVLSDRQAEEAVQAVQKQHALTPDQQERIERLRNEVKAWVIFNTARRAQKGGLQQDRGFLGSLKAGRDVALDAGRRFYEMKKSGFVPQGDELNQYFWILVLEYAESLRDAATFEEGLHVLKSRVCYVTRSDEFYKDREARLKALKEASGGGDEPPKKQAESPSSPPKDESTAPH